MEEITLEEGKKILEKIKAVARPKYSTTELTRLGESRYEQLKNEIEPKHKNEFIVIEVDSGDYFISRDSVKASLKAKKKYPESIFYLARIGYPSAFSIKGNVPLLVNKRLTIDYSKQIVRIQKVQKQKSTR